MSRSEMMCLGRRMHEVADRIGTCVVRRVLARKWVSGWMACSTPSWPSSPSSSQAPPITNYHARNHSHQHFDFEDLPCHKISRKERWIWDSANSGPQHLLALHIASLLHSHRHQTVAWFSSEYASVFFNFSPAATNSGCQSLADLILAPDVAFMRKFIPAACQCTWLFTSTTSSVSTVDSTSIACRQFSKINTQRLSG